MQTYIKILNDIQIQQETGETEADKWKRIRQEELDYEKEKIDYYKKELKKFL